MQIRGSRRPSPDSAGWLVACAILFVIAELTFVPPRMGLSWDEVVYVSQVSGHAPASYFDSARARGTSVLVAPVALLTSSTVALRWYLSVMSGLGLFGALWAWRRLRPAWGMAVAGVVFGGLWLAQYYGPQAMPDLWSALCALAAVGCFCSYAEFEASSAERARRRYLAGLAVAVGCAALVRPGDAVYLAVPLALATVLVRAWRRWQPVAALLAGLVAGAAEWVVEANARFGGVRSRVRLAGIEQGGGFGWHFSIAGNWRALNGPAPCPCPAPVTDPWPGLWWFALPVLVIAGVLAARHCGRQAGRGAALAAVCGAALAAQYVLMIRTAESRYLIPAYALFAIPVADGVRWLVTWPRGAGKLPRPAANAIAAAVALLLAAQLVSQHFVLDREVAATVAYNDDYTTEARDLASLGVRPPCLLNGGPYLPLAFYLGCASDGFAGPPPPGHHVALLGYPGQGLPPFAAHWHRHPLPGTKVIDYVAYLP